MNKPILDGHASSTAHILTYVIADLNDVRRTLQEDALAPWWDDEPADDGDTSTLSVGDIRKIIARLNQAIAGLRHVMAPDRHTAVVREECRYEEAQP